MELTDVPNMAWALFLRNGVPTTTMPARRSTRSAAPAPEPPTPAAKGARGKVESQTDLATRYQRERNLARASERALKASLKSLRKELDEARERLSSAETSHHGSHMDDTDHVMRFFFLNHRGTSFTTP